MRSSPPEDFVKENSSFGRESIRNLLVHNANCYHFWIANSALKLERPYAQINNFSQCKLLRELCEEIDNFMKLFLDNNLKKVVYTINGKSSEVSALQLFTHALTHKFHPKEQILTLNRHLGKSPVHTDVIH